MPNVDLITAAFVALVTIWGVWGGVARTLTLAGFAAGAVIGARYGPLVLNDGHESEEALVIAFPAALLAGGVLAALIERLTFRFQRGIDRLDDVLALRALGGALLAAWTALVAVWLVGAAVNQVDSVRDRVEDSRIVGNLDAVVKLPGPAKAPAERRFQSFPVVEAPAPEIPPPDPRVVRDQQVLLADESVVKITVLSKCGAVAGSGWIGANGVVVTNAHVAAAADAITVRLSDDAPLHEGIPIWYEPRNDLALLLVPGLEGVRPLPLAPRVKPGTSGAVIGFPLGMHRIDPARVGDTSKTFRGRVVSPPEMMLPRGLAGRLVTEFRGRAVPGNSGGPVVDARGRVLTTVSVGSEDGANGWGVANRIVRSALRRAGPRVSTGNCGTSRSRTRRR